MFGPSDQGLRYCTQAYYWGVACCTLWHNWDRALVCANSFGLSKLVHDATTMHFRGYSNKVHLRTVPLSFIDSLVSIFLVSATAVPRDGFPCVRSASGSTTQPAKRLHHVAKLSLHTLRSGTKWQHGHEHCSNGHVTTSGFAVSKALEMDTRPQCVAKSSIPGHICKQPGCSHHSFPPGFDIWGKALCLC